MRIGLVLPGGGARGAYEAGALSVLLPALEARGEQVEIVCGTSVGGINAAVVAAVAALPADEQALTFLDHWRSVRKGSVIRLELGRADAQRWLDEHPGFWSADAAAVGFEAPEVSSEAIALDEFRARRR